MSDLEFIRMYYDGDVQHEWERLERHRTEFAITWKVLEQYLPPLRRACLIVGAARDVMPSNWPEAVMQ